MNPLGYQEKPVPGGKRPSSRSKKGKWNEAPTDQDMPYIKEAIEIIDTASAVIQLDSGNAVKANFRRELELAGWKYKSWATFKANLPFRNKYLVFDSTYKQDHKNKHRIKVATDHGIISGYKLMKWVPKY